MTYQARQEEKNGASVESWSSSPSHREIILVVEEYDALRSLLAEFANPVDYELHSSAIVTSTISFARHCQPRVAVVDLGMKNGDPFLIVWFLRRVAPECTVVAICDEGSESKKQLGKEAGAQFLFSPTCRQELTNLLRELSQQSAAKLLATVQ